jgi:exopolysaccharide biosynthesis polyprenyl glycosylphosphotransferase
MRVLNIDVPYSAIALLCVDIVIVCFAAAMFDPGVIFSNMNSYPLEAALKFSFSLAAIAGSAFAMGLYQRRFLCAERLPARMTIAFLLSLIAVTILCQTGPAKSEAILGTTSFVTSAFLLMLASRVVACNLVDRTRRRVLFFGSGTALSQLRTYEVANQPHHYAIVGSLSADSVLDNNLAEKLAAEVQRARAKEVVVGGNEDIQNWCAMAVSSGGSASLRLTPLSKLVEREARKLDIDGADAAKLGHADQVGLSPVGAVAKRIFDIVFSCSLLVVTAPILALAAIAIKLQDGGPVFYRQERVGLHGRTFTLIKLRSMSIDAEADGVQRWASKKDSRVTSVGNFLRRSRIDEIPQLLNVLRGEMSMVGPRPERPGIVSQLERQIANYSVRHRVSPGITGWAQISYPYGASLEDAIEKTAYDLYYVKNGSLLLDIAIALQTVRVILLGEGSR